MFNLFFRIVMPPEHAHIFRFAHASTILRIDCTSHVTRHSERLLLMPRTYQVNDYPGFYRNDVPPDFAVRRSGHSLPENRVILANFNQLYKIDPQTLSLWAQILHSCASCVMWLLAFPYHAKSNMLRVLDS